MQKKLYLCTEFVKWTTMDMSVIVGSVVVVTIGVVLLCVGVIFRKDHSFRSQHIAQNERMKENKIHCATSQDREARHASSKKIDIKNL